VIETDPHNFFLEVLINSGVVMALSYILISAFLFASMITQKANRLIVAQFVIYHLLLLSSSSSLFLWSHYVFFFTYVFFAKDKGEAGTA
jgi:O-antigen ligase